MIGTGRCAGWALAAALLAARPATAWPPAPVPELVERAERLEELFLAQDPSVPLSAAYRALPLERRVLLANRLKQLIAERVPPGLESHPALGRLPPAQAAQALAAFALVRDGTPAEVERRFAAVDLDRLAPLPASVLALHQETALDGRAPGAASTRRVMLAADRKAPGAWRAALAATSGYVVADAGPQAITLYAEGDDVPDSAVPRDRDEPVLDGAAVVASRVVALPRAMLASSIALARALNLLMRAGAAGPLAVSLAGRTSSVRTTRELLAVVVEAGYEPAVFDVRMFVNFLDYSQPGPSGPRPIRIPTWAIAGTPGDELVLPVFHSEYQLALYRPGKLLPAALVRWYLGAPNDGGEQGTLFRAAYERRASWSGWRVVRAHAGVPAAQRVLDVAERLMPLFNFLEARYRFPLGVYGMLGVCNDTTGMLEAALPPHPRATVWPLVRDLRFDVYLLRALDGLGLPVRRTADGPILDEPCDVRPDVFPETADTARLLPRIGASLPVHDLDRLHFPEVAATLRRLAARHPALARALELSPRTTLPAMRYERPRGAR